jgi:hypothetical protein
MISIELDILDSNLDVIGKKTFSDKSQYLNDWFARPKCDTENGYHIPLNGALGVIESSKAKLKKTTSNAFGYMRLAGNDFQQVKSITLMSGVFENGHGSAITPTTFEPAVVSGAVRWAINHTWINDVDQFQQPTDSKGNVIPCDKLPREFVVDCILFFISNGQNNSSEFEGEYDGKKFFLKNEFFIFSKENVIDWSVGNDANGDWSLPQYRAKMVDSWVYGWLQKQDLSAEALVVVEALKAVYAVFYANWHNLDKKKFKLSNKTWKPGWYQVRMALKDANIGKAELEAVDVARKALQEKIKPQVYSFGFLDKEIDYSEEVY